MKYKHIYRPGTYLYTNLYVQNEKNRSRSFYWFVNMGVGIILLEQLVVILYEGIYRFITVDNCTGSSNCN